MRKTIISLCAFVLGTLALNAQALPILNVPTDAKTLATGATAGPSVAQLSQGKSMIEAGVSYMNWAPSSAPSSIIALDAGGHFGKMAIKLFGNFYNSQPYDLVSEQGVVTSSFTPKNSMLGLGLGFAVTKNIAVGANLKSISSNIAQDATATAFAADVILAYSTEALNLAAGVYNLGATLDYGYGAYSLPSLGRVNAQYKLPFGLAVNAEGAYLFEGGVMGGAGLDYEIAKIVDIRAGYHFGDAQKSIPSYVSAGAGVKFAGISLDFTYLVASETLAGSMLIGLRCAF